MLYNKFLKQCWLLSCSIILAYNAQAETYDFRVFLDDKEIGYQRMKVSREGEEDRVTIEADLKVKVLLFNAYAYQHEAEERWRDDCLVELKSETQEKGDDFFVQAKATDKGLAVKSHDGKATLEGCNRSFAYWDIERLEVDKLLNAQTGKTTPASLSDEGEVELDVQGKTQSVQQFVLSTDESDINIFYDLEQNWVALQTEVKGGRTLSYFRTPILLPAK